jgi:hypothetical protein
MCDACDNPTGTIDLDSGTILGEIKDGCCFQFIMTAKTQVVTITGKAEDGTTNCAWFDSCTTPITPGSASIPIGSTSVNVTAVMESELGEYFTYLLAGMVQSATPHVVVSDQMPAHERKAS